MRDPERIDPIIEELRRVWKDNPDMRLTQLMWNMALPTDDESAPKFYNIEDWEVYGRLLHAGW